MPLDPLQERIARTALSLPKARTLALAGGAAMIAHDFVTRVTKDIDLFTEAAHAGADGNEDSRAGYHETSSRKVLLSGPKGIAMADSRGVVIITVALIGAAATIIAALIGRSDGGSTTPSVLLPSTTSPSPLSDVAIPPIQPGFAQPEPTAPEPAVASPPAASGDLGLSRSITRPACDGRFVVFVGAAVHPAAYRTEVQDLLDAHPGSEYLLAGDTCPSLRSRDNAGNEIYGVYYGPFANRNQACSARSSRGGGSYVKVLDTVTDSDVIIGC